MNYNDIFNSMVGNVCWGFTFSDNPRDVPIIFQVGDPLLLSSKMYGHKPDENDDYLGTPRRFNVYGKWKVLLVSYRYSLVIRGKTIFTKSTTTKAKMYYSRYLCGSMLESIDIHRDINGISFKFSCGIELKSTKMFDCIRSNHLHDEGVMEVIDYINGCKVTFEKRAIACTKYSPCRIESEMRR